MIEHMFPSLPVSADARRLAFDLAAQLADRPDVEALALFGSVARGDYDRSSDIDMLVLADESLSPSKLHRVVREHDAALRFAPSVWTWTRLERRVEYGSLFLRHVHREGEVLLDPEGRLSSVLEAASRTISIERELSAVARRLRAYDDPLRFGTVFLFPLAHLYILAKRTAMIGVAAREQYEFRHTRVFNSFAELYPEAACEAQVAASLRPFYAQTKELPTGDMPSSSSDVSFFTCVTAAVNSMVGSIAASGH
jgi:uncharacterized protein